MIWMLPAGWVELRPLTGHDERSLDSADLAATIGLIDRLIVTRPGSFIAPGQAVTLSSALRDRVLAGIYTAVYGDMIASSPHCTQCGERYDLTFSLSSLLESLPVVPRPPDGMFAAGDVRFRLPTGADELAVTGLPPDAARRELLRRCVDAETTDPGGIEAEMERVAPLINLEVAAVCPACGAGQQAHFDIGTYLMRRLLAEKERLPHEIHALAVTYHWGLQEILDLTRAERRRFLALIDKSAASTRSAGNRRLG